VSGAAAIVGLGIAVLLLVPMLPELVLRRELWAFEPLGELPLALRVGLAAALTATLHPAVRAGFTRTVDALAARAAWWRTILIGAVPLLLGLFAAFRQRNLRLGDGALLALLVEQRVHLEGYLAGYDEPLELYLHSLAYGWLHAAFEWDVTASYALLSSLAGVGFVWVMIVLWREAPGSSPIGGVVAVLLSLATPSVQLFFGYVENYTLVALASLVYLLTGLRSLERGLSPLWPALALGVAISLHVLAGWLGPSLLYVFWRSARARGFTGRIRLLAAMGATSLLPIAATIAWLTVIGVPIGALGETHLAALKFIFLVDPDAPYFIYPAFSSGHWRDIANQLALTSLAPLLVIVALVPAMRSRGVAQVCDAHVRFLALGAGFLHLFALTWNAENGAYNDWDLFALAGFFDAMLAARLVQRALPDDAQRVALALPAVALGFALAAGFVWANHTRTLALPSGHAAAHLRKGAADVEAGRTVSALREFEAALRIAPENVEALYAVGSRLWNTGNRGRSVVLLRRFLTLRPNDERASELRRLLGEPDRS
jgi:tetratricopeptide (TPR) repeat protein